VFCGKCFCDRTSGRTAPYGSSGRDRVNPWWWVDLGIVLWWLFAGIVGLLALLLAALNLKDHLKG
jgi:hypothetical protein